MKFFTKKLRPALFVIRIVKLRSKTSTGGNIWRGYARRNISVANQVVANSPKQHLS